jgi:hypothetical protein
MLEVSIFRLLVFEVLETSGSAQRRCCTTWSIPKTMMRWFAKGE